jgi:hypothetical protein
MPTPRKYEAQFNLIIANYGTEMITDWVVKRGTPNERTWWAIKLLQWDTGERFTNAEQIAAWGLQKTRAIRTALSHFRKKRSP